MMEKTLIPDFSMSEPNMVSARRKNEEGICAIHECKNKLNDPPAYGFLGVKICNKCRKPIDKEMQEYINEMDKYIIELYTRYFENKEKNEIS